MICAGLEIRDVSLILKIGISIHLLEKPFTGFAKGKNWFSQPTKTRKSL